jgi:glycosyltransferase involved in cell wall biosynthesis
VEIYGSYGVPINKIFITYNSPDTDLWLSVKEKLQKDKRVERKKFRLVHLSRLVYTKRVDMVIQAVANLKEDYPLIDLIIIGEGPEKENLIRQANRSGVSSSIQFIGGVYDPTLLGEYLMSASVYVLAGLGRAVH